MTWTIVPEPNPLYKGPAVVELMGHRKLVGLVDDVDGFGGQLLQIDVALPGDRSTRQFYGHAALFCVTPIDEATISEAMRNDNQYTLYCADLLTEEEQAHFRERLRGIPDEPEDLIDIDDDDEDAESQGEEFDAGRRPITMALAQ